MIDVKINESRFTHTDLFNSNSATTFLMSNSPTNRMLLIANRYKIDFFVNILYTFKSNLKLYI